MQTSHPTRLSTMHKKKIDAARQNLLHREVDTCVSNPVQLHSDLLRRKCCRMRRTSLFGCCSHSAGGYRRRNIFSVFSGLLSAKQCLTEATADRRLCSLQTLFAKRKKSCIQKEMTQSLQIFFLLSSCSGFDTKKDWVRLWTDGHMWNCTENLAAEMSDLHLLINLVVILVRVYW